MDFLQRQRLTTAVAVGLGLGLLAGGLLLLVLAGRRLEAPIDCTLLSVNECALEQELATSLARRQGLGGLALTGLAVAMLWLTWLSRRKAPGTAA